MLRLNVLYITFWDLSNGIHGFSYKRTWKSTFLPPRSEPCTEIKSGHHIQNILRPRTGTFSMLFYNDKGIQKRITQLAVFFCKVNHFFSWNDWTITVIYVEDMSNFIFWGFGKEYIGKSHQFIRIMTSRDHGWWHQKIFCGKMCLGIF